MVFFCEKKELNRLNTSFPNAREVEYKATGNFVCEKKSREMIEGLRGILKKKFGLERETCIMILPGV